MEDDADRAVVPVALAGIGALVTFTLLILTACSSPALPEPPTVGPTALPTAAATVERPLSIAVAVGSPTPTPELLGDYPTLVRPRLEHIQSSFNQLEEQLAVLRKDPIRMAQDDWRNQMQNILDDLALSEADLRTLSSRVAAPLPPVNSALPSLSTEVMKVIDDLDFVVSEWRMALDYDPDSSHFIRADRAEKITAAEVDSILSDLRRPIGPAPTRTPAN